MLECPRSGALISDIHSSWKGDYDRLEEHHGYIQWLFPLPEPGMNSRAFELTPDEARTIANDPELKQRAVTSYRLVLQLLPPSAKRGTHLVVGLVCANASGGVRCAMAQMLDFYGMELKSEETGDPPFVDACTCSLHTSCT